MKSSIIFYSARKTSLCEKALRKCLPELGLNLSSAVFATKRPALGEALTQAFADADCGVPEGGIGSSIHNRTDARPRIYGPGGWYRCTIQTSI